MQTVTIIHNPLDRSSWQTHEVEDVRQLLVETFPSWPSTARIYHEQVSVDRDVTPGCAEDVERLAGLDGQLYVVVYPEDPVTIIVAVVAVALTAAAAFLLLPSAPSLGNRTAQSPNNDLSARSNRPRPNGRIPDIYGRVVSTPDLLAAPYSIYEDHQEVEISYLCIGRGEYEIEEVRDGDTPIQRISGAAVEIYGPGTSPNSGDPPLQTIGSAIGEEVAVVTRLNEVNGQVLRSPNANAVSAQGEVRFVFPDTVELQGSSDIDFTDFFAPTDEVVIGSAIAPYVSVPAYATSQECRFTLAGEIEFSTYDPSAHFSAGQTITVANGGYSGPDAGSSILYVDLSGQYVIDSVSSAKITLVDPDVVNGYWLLLDDYAADRTEYGFALLSRAAGNATLDLSGTYEVVSVTSGTLVLSNPVTENADWGLIEDLPGGATAYGDASISSSGERWVGPFIIDDPETTTLVANFVALQGLFKDNGKKQTPVAVQVVLEATPIDEDEEPTGAATLFYQTLDGNREGRDSRAATLQATLPTPGRYSVRARRLTATDLNFNGTVVDEVKWRDLYGLAPPGVDEFGDVTTILSKTYATAGALAVKDRKLNCTVTRKIPTRVSGTTFRSPEATSYAPDILVALATDPFIGRRSLAELDLDEIYSVGEEIVEYFSSASAAEFNYTFDDDGLSFEESAAALASAIFCTAYRSGSLISLSLERQSDVATLLFNHRNKMPGSERRTVRFGPQSDNDGVELEYVDPEDGSARTIYIPEDRSATNPRTVKTLGVTNEDQAYWHAWRAYNKIIYQSAAVEFEATQEAALLLTTDRVIVADNTRPDTQDGEVLEQNGLELTLSQPVVFADGATYTIFLQHTDGTVESMAVTPGPSSRVVTLEQAPRAPLALGMDLFAQATYEIVRDDSPRPRAFLVTEKDPGDGHTYTVRAVNYDDRYYQMDGVLP